MRGAFPEGQVVCAAGHMACGQLGEETELGFVWDLFQPSSSLCPSPPLRKCLFLASGVWGWGRLPSSR